MYAILYHENENTRTWKKGENIETIETYAKDNNIKDYDVYISLNDYNKLMAQVMTLKETIETIKNMCDF